MADGVGRTLSPWGARATRPARADAIALGSRQGALYERGRVDPAARSGSLAVEPGEHRRGHTPDRTGSSNAAAWTVPNRGRDRSLSCRGGVLGCHRLAADCTAV